MLWLLALACTADGDTALVNGGDPYVAFLTPTEGAIVCGDPLQVEVEVANFVLVAPVDDPNDAEPGTGHVDITLNGQDAAMIWETTTEIAGVEDGEYQLKAELSHADHTPIEPYTRALIYITVDAGACD